MEKYYVFFEDENQKYELFQYEDEVNYENEKIIKTFDTYKEIINYCKNELTKVCNHFQVMDYDCEGIATFKDGNVFTESCMGINDSYMIKHWINDGKSVKREYEVQCTACGDGGCVHCEPHRFI